MRSNQTPLASQHLTNLGCLGFQILCSGLLASVKTFTFSGGRISVFLLMNFNVQQLKNMFILVSGVPKVRAAGAFEARCVSKRCGAMLGILKANVDHVRILCYWRINQCLSWDRFPHTTKLSPKYLQDQTCGLLENLSSGFTHTSQNTYSLFQA